MHSGEANCGDTTGCTYYDSTCIMSYTNGDNNLRKCFNAAKMSELGWYDDRSAVIDVRQNEEFDGKVIGVNDYAISSSSYTAFLEIKKPGENSYFLTYNKVEGMTDGTLEAQNKIVVVQGAPDEQSWKLAEIGPGQNVQFPDFYNGRNLIITVGAEVSDGSVDYLPVTVKQEVITCSANSDCVSATACTTGACISGTCAYTMAADCCGNGICELIDGGCGTCTADCVSPTDCNEIDGLPDNQGVGSFSSSVYGIVFDVILKTNVWFYELEADLANPSVRYCL